MMELEWIQKWEEFGFDRNGFWHKQLADGSYSKECQEFDDEGYDVHGFNSKNKTREGSDFINGFYRIRRKDGTIDYINRYTDSPRDRDGYDIDGFDERGFNREGIHRDTGIAYNKAGIKDYGFRRTAFPLLEAIQKGDDTTLIEFLVLHALSPSIENQEWYKAVEARVKNLKNATKEKCSEYIESRRILATDRIEQEAQLDKQIEEEEKRRQMLIENRAKVIVDIEKLVGILKGNWVQVQEGGER